MTDPTPPSTPPSTPAPPPAPPIPSPAQPPDQSATWVLLLVLAALCLFIRLLGLNRTGLNGAGALPIFGDEAIYLRWAQLIRDGHWWISLIDPKPPIHFWLIALVYNFTRDPLLAARLLSVAAGVLSVPILAPIWHELAQFPDKPTSFSRKTVQTPRIFILISALFFIFCPFLNFYQRLATADALFVFQMLLALWLSLRWARLAATRQSPWLTAIALGTTMGCAMMTRQGLSYLLWAIPLLAFALHTLRPHFKTLLLAATQLLLAAAIATLLWLPYLTAELPRFSAERGGTASEIKTRILYQNQFTDGTKSRKDIALWNATCVFLPTWNPDGQPETGWLYLYLTPPIYLASLGGFLWLALRRDWRLLLLLLAWTALMLGVPMLLGAVLRSRYILAAVPPLLFSATIFTLELLGLFLSLRRQWLGWLFTSLFLISLILLPVKEIAHQSSDWWNQTLTREDRYQHITGWTAGLATMQAIRFIQNFHPPAPIVVITNNGWGTPADAEWVYLSQWPNVSVYYTNHKTDRPLLLPAPGGSPDTYLLRKDKWLYTPEVPVHLPPDAILLYMNNDPVYTSTGPVDAETFFHRENPNLLPVETFNNVGAGADRVVLFELKPEARKTNE